MSFWSKDPIAESLAEFRRKEKERKIIKEYRIAEIKKRVDLAISEGRLSDVLADIIYMQTHGGWE